MMRVPNTPQEMTSPIPTVRTKYGNISHPPIPEIISTHGMISAFETIVGIEARYGNFFMKNATKAPIRVANVPKIISYIVPPQRIFETRHPIVNPGTAANV